MYEINYEEHLDVGIYFNTINTNNVLKIYEYIKNNKEELYNELSPKLKPFIDSYNLEIDKIQDNRIIIFNFENNYTYRIDKENNYDFISDSPDERRNNYLAFVNKIKDILTDKGYIFDYEPEIINSNLDEDLIFVEEYERGN